MKQERCGLECVAVALSLCFALGLVFNIRAADVNPPMNMDAAIHRIQFESLCGMQIHRNFEAAREEKKDYLAAIKELSYKSDPSEVERLSRQVAFVMLAQVIDQAITQRDVYAKISKTGNFASAYQELAHEIDSVASKNWKVNTISETEANAVDAAQRAYSIDAAVALKQAYMIGGLKKLADAYKANVDRLVSLAKKEWKQDEISKSEVEALNQAQVALFSDVAGVLLAKHRASKPPIFKDIVDRDWTNLESLIKKDWKTDSLTLEESQSLCHVVSAYRNK